MQKLHPRAKMEPRLRPRSEVEVRNDLLKRIAEALEGLLALHKAEAPVSSERPSSYIPPKAVGTRGTRRIAGCRLPAPFHVTHVDREFGEIVYTIEYDAGLGDGPEWLRPGATGNFVGGGEERTEVHWEAT